MSDTKQTILNMLENNKGQSVSGSYIASKLSISRTAVWKAVNSLKQEGYHILGVNNLGYRLELESDILSAQSILPYVNNKEFFKDIIVYKSLGSTNDEARILANKSAKSGTVVIAEQQTSGKGRLGREFYSPASSGIYMSVIFKLDNPVEQAILITSAAAVAVCRAIKKICGVDCQIKWVNDVYLNSKKLCGILTEASMNFEAGILDYIVVGIGINVLESNFSPALKEIATSLSEIGIDSISRSEIIGEVLNQLFIVINDLQSRSFMEEYKQRSFILGSRINIIAQGKTQPALAVDFNDFGHLIVKLDNGEMKTLSSGEISIRKI